jgi:hypothetical protein
MEDKTTSFLACCADTDFGSIVLSKTEKSFYERFNREMVSLCRSLPDSVRADSLLFLLKYSGLTPGDELDFFTNYYPPSWSVLYWLSRNRTNFTGLLRKEDVGSAITAQSMAMFLHSLDDHLTDSQVSVSPLSLLLRSQAWTIMNRAFYNLAEGIPTGERTVRSFIDEYYSSIQELKKPKSLNSYCDLFRGQMGIGMIAPTLLSMKIGGSSDFTKDVQVAYGSFGIAWRLLDDIKDIGADMEKGAYSAIYVCLPEKVRTHWNTLRDRGPARAVKRSILIHIMVRSVVDRIRGRICAELDRASSLVEAHGLKGLAREFRDLAHPFRSSVSA